MRTLEDFEKSHGRFVVCDFVYPTKATKENFAANIIVKMDSVKNKNLRITINFFKNSEKVDFHITEWNEYNHETIAKEILKYV